MESQIATGLKAPISESLAGLGSGYDVIWLEVKKRRRGLVTKRRKPIPVHSALALKRKAISTVTYSRTAFEGSGWRVTLDRAVQCKNSILGASYEGMVLPAVVVEVKGNPPKWVLRALGSPNKKFSKSRWSTARDA